MHKKISFKGIRDVLKDTIDGFSDNKTTKLSASLAYYTIFSMGPLLVVIIALCGLFFEKAAVEGKIYFVLQDFVGRDTAAQLERLIQSAALDKKDIIATIIGFVTLLLGATSVFGEIQESINQIWGLKPKPKKNWLKLLQNRFLSFSIIVSLGFLLLVSLTITSVIEGINASLRAQFPDAAVFVFYLINLLLTFGISILIFAVIFKVLPDARIRWKDILAGAVITAILFLLGKFGISLYISKTNIGSTYGAAGSLVVLMVWIYYSSLILYIGASFTKAYALHYGAAIHPSNYAVTIKEIEVETDKQTIQQNEINHGHPHN